MKISRMWFATLLLVVFMAVCADTKGIVPAAAIVPESVMSSTNPAKGAPGAAAAGKIIVIDQLVMLEIQDFNFDQSTLAAEGEKMLQQNIKIMQDNPGLKVRIAGYASAQGTTEYNQELSERRADAVMTYLIDEGGIAPGRLDKIGNGKTRPSIYEENPADISSMSARANMKVLFEVIVK